MASCIKNQQRTERDQLKENVYKQMLLLPMGMDESLPFPLVPHLDSCYVCKEFQNDTNTMSMCGGCHKIRYCGTVCFTKDWPRHQIICNPIRKKARLKRERKEKRIFKIQKIATQEQCSTVINREKIK